MNLVLEPQVGASNLLFGVSRNDVRSALVVGKLETKDMEPENDFYESEGLILGYDEKDELEYIEIIKPSTVEYKGTSFFSLSLSKCIAEMNSSGHTSELEDGGYNFKDIGIAFYCPQGVLESVSIYREGYYDDL